jgi:hypothetical protein
MNYLILIGCIDLLPALFEKVILPAPVLAELSARKAPPPVRHWAANPPAWIEVRETPDGFDTDPVLKGIHASDNTSSTNHLPKPQGSSRCAASKIWWKRLRHRGRVFRAGRLLRCSVHCVLLAQSQGPEKKRDNPVSIGEQLNDARPTPRKRDRTA